MGSALKDNVIAVLDYFCVILAARPCFGYQLQQGHSNAADMPSLGLLKVIVYCIKIYFQW